MKYWYDTEFLEDGRTIDLISIAIVAEDGREYYAVNRYMPTQRALKHPWLPANVLVHLPLLLTDTTKILDVGHHSVRSVYSIANDIEQFLKEDESVELWADYAAYDHITLMQLYGTMLDRPKHFPMFTHDLQQEFERLGSPEGAPVQKPETEHHALYDARHNRDFDQFLQAYRDE